MRLTMSDVARKAGVSAATVCRALKADPRVNAETRERVCAVAKSMGYSLDPLLSAFASRKRGRTEGTDVTVIAFVSKFSGPMEWRKNPYYRRMFDGAQRRAQELGYKLENFWLGEPGMTSSRMSRILHHRGISAVFVCPMPRVRSHISLDWKSVSSITVGYSLLRPKLHRVSSHMFHGVLTCVRELQRNGYKRIGFCTYRDTSQRVDNMPLAGFQLLRSMNKHIKLSAMLVDDETLSDIPAWCTREELEVVIGSEPEILKVLRTSGLFPEKIDYASGSWSDEEPLIAGLDQLPDEIGAKAVELVVGQLQRQERGVPMLACTTMVEGVWRRGASLRLMP